MRIYELTYLTSPDIEETTLNSIREKIISQIQENGGLLLSVNSPVKRTLFYPIKKKTEAFLVSLEFQLKPTAIEKLEKNLKAESNILRYLILSKKLPKKVAKAPLKKVKKGPPKVELKDIEKKLKEILNEI